MRHITLVFLIGLALCTNSYAGRNELQYQPVPEKPEIRDLGDDKYQVGKILIDKDERTFSLPGKILRVEPPIEFLAVMKDGYKAYESLLELETNAVEFNLACILIGMEENKGQPPKFHFDPTPLQGSSAEILLSWKADGKTVEISATELFKPVKPGEKDKDEDEGDWVYTGSTFTPDGKYGAQMTGTLVGLVHDPLSIIEHRTGYGQASYGILKPDLKLLPPLETPIQLIVKRKN